MFTIQYKVSTNLQNSNSKTELENHGLKNPIPWTAKLLTIIPHVELVELGVKLHAKNIT